MLSTSHRARHATRIDRETKEARYSNFCFTVFVTALVLQRSPNSQYLSNLTKQNLKDSAIPGPLYYVDLNGDSTNPTCPRMGTPNYLPVVYF